MTLGRPEQPVEPVIETVEPTVEPTVAPPVVEAPSLADRVAAAALAVPGVTALHGGTFAVGTYLAGRRVLGVRLGKELTELHVEVAMGVRIPDVATAVVAAVEPLTGTPVQVFVEDVTDTSVTPDPQLLDPAPDAAPAPVTAPVTVDTSTTVGGT